MPTTPATSCTGLLACATMIASTTAAAATGGDGPCDEQVLVWNGGSGSMLDPRNWSPPTVPNGDSTLVFEELPPIGVGLYGADLLVKRFIHRGSTLTLVLDLAEFTATSGALGCPALEIGGPGPAQLILPPDGPNDVRLDVASAIVGTADGPGIVRTQGFYSFTFLDAVAELVIGGTSDGDVNRLAGVTAGSLTIGQHAAGRLDRVNDVAVAGMMVVGDADFGELDRSRVRAAELVIGSQRTGQGDVRIADEDWLFVAQDAEVGGRGRGLLRVDGGTVQVGGDLRIGVFAIGKLPGFFDRGDGRVSIIGGQSVLQVNGDVAIGLLGHAELEVSSAARVEVGGSVTTNAADLVDLADQRVIIHLENVSEAAAPVIRAEGAIELPPLVVQFVPGFQPAVGDSWTLVDAGTLLTMSPLTPPAFPLLPPGRAWSVLEDGRRLVATVVELAGIPEDLDGDGIVGLGDLLIVLASFGPCPAGEPCPADLDGNGEVGFVDLVQVLGGWSEPTP